MKRNWKPLLILALIAVAVYYLYPSIAFYGLSVEEKAAMEQNAPERLEDLHRRSINLGLDLQGGIHLVLEVDLTELPAEEARDAVDRAQEVIRNRIDQFGVAEPTIQRQGANRIVVELPGVQDVQRAKGLVGQTALLEFQLLEPYVERDRIIQRIDAILDKEKDSGEDLEEGEQGEKGLFEEAEEDEPARARTLSALLAPSGDDLAFSVKNLSRVRAMLRDPGVLDAVPGDMEFVFSSKPQGPQGNQYYLLYLVRQRPEMTGNAVEDAYVSFGQSVENLGQPIVNLTTTDEGTRIFARTTGAHVGERLAVVLDGAVYSAPEIQTRIPYGRAIITGSADEAEAKDLAIVLRAGALPARVEIIEDRTVGPSLGRDSIEQGRVAALYCTVVVALFMILYYRAAGLIADLALGLNIVFVMAVLSGFHATLTLPGIAGIILTIGMAVDANVLIFERIREELRSGKTLRAAVDSGYSNALSAIIDANLTTLMVGIVLYQFGTGPIRGFALTLCIGIISSLFTAFFVTRSVFDLITRSSRVRSLSLGPVRVLSNSRIPFLSRYKHAFATSAVVLGAGVVSVVGINGIPLGIDFAGGTLLEVHFEPAVEVKDIRAKMDAVPVDDKVLDLSSSEIKQFGSPNDILIRIVESETGTDVADGIKQVLKSGFGSHIPNELEWIRRQEKVGPKIGSELSGAAVNAVLVALVLILIYMAWRFHRFLYGIAAVIALFHDVLVTMGLLSLLNVEITLAVVAGLLAIVGYSLNDTIVVFDRVRENLHSVRKGAFAGILNISINECLSRTLVTSMTTLMAVLILMTWGGEVIRDFTITLLIGILVGTYSSIFIASPALYIGQEYTEKKKQNK